MIADNEVNSDLRQHGWVPVIAMAADPDEPASAVIPMPRPSEDAIDQIHDFIGHFVDLFEARCDDQIHRFYEDRSTHSTVSTEPTHSIDDPPI